MEVEDGSIIAEDGTIGMDIVVEVHSVVSDICRI